MLHSYKHRRNKGERNRILCPSQFNIVYLCGIYNALNKREYYTTDRYFCLPIHSAMNYEPDPMHSQSIGFEKGKHHDDRTHGHGHQIAGSMDCGRGSQCGES
jgi:hypothetical protein